MYHQQTPIGGNEISHVDVDVDVVAAAVVVVSYLVEKFRGSDVSFSYMRAFPLYEKEKDVVKGHNMSHKAVFLFPADAKMSAEEATKIPYVRSASTTN